ncbi:carbamoyltransferase C-terminal domain-containing protein [Paenibacillus pinihumi]|uniref:carbamoyltransferase C-terminal domain-containing protein n=1 Tax=Paenibacillus pinihumi TaxID=669462 RepID=UPI0004272D53|nr:carbamoyltransferase C-terminal domain-containing protein [Paenibacillus pinihumi]
MLFSPYLGRTYSEAEIAAAINRYEDRVTARKCQNVFKEAAASIANGKIIGWFQGGAECGPRSLGNRSFLADPRRAEMKDIVNARVKFREGFRPFAPSVLWEHQQEYFDLAIPSPYMLMVADIWPRKRSIIPAVTHIDGTGRLQTVMKELNPHYYQLIETFYEMTDVPVVLNTSFNVKGEPIVETPEDAIRCFLGSNFDELYLGDVHVVKL